MVDEPTAGERVAVAYLSRTKGIKGWVVAEPLTDDLERFDELEHVEIDVDRRGAIVASIEAWRVEGTSVLLKFAGVDTPEQAREQVVKGYVTIPRDQVAPLPEGQHYVFDLIGCQIVDEQGQDLGTVTDVLRMPSADVMSVRRRGGPEVMIPMVGDFIDAVDTSTKRIQVRGVEELFED